MACRSCNSNFNYNISNAGPCGGTGIFTIDGSNRTLLNWTEIPVTEILPIPALKPNIESIDQVYVDVKLNSIKLIETPFAYQTYNRTITAAELTAITAALTAATIAPALITAITAAVTALLAVPGLGALPGVGPYLTAIQNAATAVTTAATNLAATITAATAAITADTLACLAVSVLEAVQTSVIALRTALNALLAAVQALVTFTASDLVIGPLVATAAAAVVTAVNAVLTEIVDALVAILEALQLLLGSGTQYFVIISNAEGTCLSGRKLIIEGDINQKIVYTGLVREQSVHSAHYTMPFSAFIIPYASFDGLTYQQNVPAIDADGNPVIISGFAFNPGDPIVPNLCEEFSVKSITEDVFACALDERTVFKNVTLFLYAKPVTPCLVAPVVPDPCVFTP